MASKFKPGDKVKFKKNYFGKYDLEAIYTILCNEWPDGYVLDEDDGCWNIPVKYLRLYREDANKEKKMKKYKFQVGDKVRIAPTTYKRYFDEAFNVQMRLEGEDGYLPNDVYTIIDYDGSYLPYRLNVDFGGLSFTANQLIKVDDSEIIYEEDQEGREDPSIYHQVANEIADLLEEKNKSYGSSFEKSQDILNVLYPNGISKEQFKDALVVTRIIDKLFRIANNKEAFAEDPWKDIAGYALLMLGNNKND